MSKNYIKKLCICSVLAALYVALEWIASTFGKIAFLDNYQIPISCFPLILASVMFGFSWGTITAIVGSFISQLSYGISWNTLLWMAPTVIYSMSVALLYLAFHKKDKPLILGVQFFISSILLSCLNTLAMYLSNWIADLSNGLLKIFLPIKIGAGIVFAFIFAFIIPIVIKRFKKILKL
ncbi:MAG: ECF transporter S component [Ruminococcaceae bacterium]|nr:ECF transporter S component [Oscillospiraceae bacterium]